MGRKSKANGGVVQDDQNENEELKEQYDQAGKYYHSKNYSIQDFLTFSG